MYYFSLDTISNAITELRGNIPSKFIGLLSLLKNSGVTLVKPNQTYCIADTLIADWLNSMMLMEETPPISSGSKLYIRFAVDWDDSIANQIFSTKTSIYPLLVFLYKFTSFQTLPSQEELLQRFISEFHIPEQSIFKWFSQEHFEMKFSQKCVTRKEIRTALNIQYDTMTFDGSYSVKAKPSELSRAPFIQTLYAGMDSMGYILLARENLDTLYPALHSLNDSEGKYTHNSLQVIYFGAPGSGKSHKVAEDLAGIDRENIFRTTFHPDYDYASFVGCYKPEMRSEPTWEESYTLDELLAIIPNEVRVGENYPVEKFCLRHYRSIEKLNISSSQKNELRVKILQAAKNSDEQQAEGKTIQTATVLAGAALGRYLEDNGILSASGNNTAIAYAFTPQVFTNAYVRAWEHPNEKVYLVIEEINRGNCAQIFGDLFQLLDRKDDGTSCYSIRADKDLADYLQYVLSGDAKRGIEGGNLCLPPNLHIIATMNTSDQSLFPMDSAFKRRWDWEYIPINYSDEVKSGQFVITINDKNYKWVTFLKAVNRHIRDLTHSEDKQMGNFFVKNSIEKEAFKSKVMAYLWHEVCKDEYGTQGNFFRSYEEEKKDVKEFSFNELYEKDDYLLLQGFMAYLGVPVIEEENTREENE